MAIDNAPFMIDRAVEEARRTGSHVDFLLADVLDHDLGSGQYDLVVFLGNPLSDFPVGDAFELARRVRRSLRRRGRFAVHYIDGFFPFVQETYLREGIEQEEPIRATRRFKAYDARSGSFAETYGNEATGKAWTIPAIPTPLRLCAACSGSCSRSRALSRSAREATWTSSARNRVKSPRTTFARRQSSRRGWAAAGFVCPISERFLRGCTSIEVRGLSRPTRVRMPIPSPRDAYGRRTRSAPCPSSPAQRLPALHIRAREGACNR